ncbi:hypothetical protein [Agromyces sp. ZXT2-6]|uniref:hypothetical protein n=1 Tax=Agromyces sp. ZXT2-6 TaxID=3461153 RepID=UPI004054D845
MVQRPEDGAARGRALRWFGTVSPAAVIGALLAVLSLALPALWALGVAAVAIALGVIGRRQFRADPSTGPGWISLAAIALGGFVFVSQGILLLVATIGN